MKRARSKTFERSVFTFLDLTMYAWQSMYARVRLYKVKAAPNLIRSIKFLIK